MDPQVCSSSSINHSFITRVRARCERAHELCDVRCSSNSPVGHGASAFRRRLGREATCGRCETAARHLLQVALLYSFDEGLALRRLGQHLLEDDGEVVAEGLVVVGVEVMAASLSIILSSRIGACSGLGGCCLWRGRRLARTLHRAVHHVLLLLKLLLDSQVPAGFVVARIAAEVRGAPRGLGSLSLRLLLRLVALEARQIGRAVGVC